MAMIAPDHGGRRMAARGDATGEADEAPVVVRTTPGCETRLLSLSDALQQKAVNATEVEPTTEARAKRLCCTPERPPPRPRSEHPPLATKWRRAARRDRAYSAWRSSRQGAACFCRSLAQILVSSGLTRCSRTRMQRPPLTACVHAALSPIPPCTHTSL